jgi:hypothetical protein
MIGEGNGLYSGEGFARWPLNLVIHHAFVRQVEKKMALVENAFSGLEGLVERSCA